MTTHQLMKTVLKVNYGQYMSALDSEATVILKQKTFNFCFK